MCFILSACATTQTKIQNAEIFAAQLEKAENPIDIINAYEKVNNKCRGKLYYDTYEYKAYEMETGQDCFNEIATAKQDIDFGCKYEKYKGKNYYDSDDCIIYRRNHKWNEMNFDFARFLPKNSPIKTEQQFLTWVGYYNNIDTVRSYKTTRAEHDSYISTKMDVVKQMATSIVDCIIAYHTEYTAFLDEKWDDYNDMITYDPQARASYFRSIGAYDVAWLALQDRRRSPSEALAGISSAISDWGKEKNCGTQNWKTEMRARGHKF